MEFIEIKAEVFKVVRANQDKPTAEILKLLDEHLPDVSKDLKKQALQELLF